MENFFKSLFRKAQEGASNVAGRAIDLFEQQADEQDREATLAEKAGSKIGDFFEPQPIEEGIRVRDVVRGLPEGFADVVGRPILRSFAALGTKAANLDPRATFVPETDYEKDLFGTDKEISFSSIGKETRLADEDAKTIPVLDPTLGFIIASADAASGGRAKPLAKGVSFTVKELRNLAKIDNIAEITKVLRSGGLDAKTAKEAAKDIAKVSKQSDVENIIRSRATAASSKAPTKVTQVTKADPEEPQFKSMSDIFSERTAGKTTRAAGKAEDFAGDTRPALKPKKDERRFITRARALEPNLDEFLDGAKTTRSTDELAATADNLIETDIEKAIDIAKNGTDDNAVATASRLIDKYVNEASEATSDAARTKLWEAASDIANDAARNLTENGRAIQAASLLGKTTPEGMVRFAARTIQNHNEAVRKAKNPVEKTIGNLFGTRDGKALKEIPELTGEQAEDIVKRMKEIEGIEDEVERAMKMKELTDEISSFLPSSLYQKIVNVWKAGLLTGLKTTGLNIASNTAHFASEIIKDVPASVVDRIASIFTGKRTLAATTKGMPKGLKEGAQKGWRYWRTGFDERDIGAKLDYKKINFGKSKLAKAIQAYEETVFKTIGAQDQPFYYASKMRSLASQAIAQARNEGLKGKAAKEFVENLMANPTDDMIKYSVLDAETAVFQNKTQLGKLARAIQNLPGGQIVLPFGKTPSAVATQIINYSPVGIVKTIIENIGKGKFDQRLFSQGLGRGITGTAPIAIGMSLYANDMLTLGYPTSQREREQWELEGRVPNSVNIDGEWRNVAVLGPVGLLLTIGGHYQNGIDETGSTIGGLASSAAGFGNTLTEQSFLKGINQAIEAINDPNRSFEGFASSLAGSVVPTIIADIARASDQYERQTSGPWERFQSRLPGVRETLEPRVTTLGNKVETMGGAKTMLDPTRPGNEAMREEDRPIVEELRRLNDAGYMTTPTDIVPKAGFESLTPEENTYLRRLTGTAVRDQLKEVMEHPSYMKADDELRSKTLNDRVQDIKIETRARTVLKATEGLEGAELQRKLAQMKQEGLLTKQVFTLYQSLKRRAN